jgi:biopolymer transport protein ExbD
VVDATQVAGPDKPTIVVAVDANGRYFYQNQMIEAGELRDRLAARVREFAEPPALVVRADKAVTQDIWLRLVMIAREAGIREAWPAVLPRLFDPVSPGVNRPGP